ncbi:MAG: 16S rRNA (uracil(1498)-N(3))-methyltransferase [Planctomycetes bacterium]|nr:16S rRNA (uracil(1498)-N(3))-methyltransferase [Planctomycetota bacterium]
MSHPRLFCPTLTAGVLTLQETESHHALHSRRLRPGDPVLLFDGRGHDAEGSICDAEDQPAAQPTSRRPRKRGRSTCVRVAEVRYVPPPDRQLTLLVAGCKGPRLTWLVEKCTELGVIELVFIEFERSVVRVGPKHLEKLRRTAIEACKQCGRLWLPEINARGKLTALVPEAADGDLLVAHPAADAMPLGKWLHEHRTLTSEFSVVIGPEGGLTPSELDFLKTSGGRLVRLSEHVLRVETAAVAAAAHWAAYQEPTRS